MAEKSIPFVQEMGERQTSFGWALYIRIYTNNYRELSWTEVWETFSSSYPDQWAVQFFPPAHEVLDEENMYHLFVLQDDPSGVNIRRR